MIKSFYLNKLAYYIAGSAAIVYVLSFFFPTLFNAANVLLVLLAIGIGMDILILYSKANGLDAERLVGERFSNGDENKVTIHIHNNFSFPVTAAVIDELPFQFQERDWVRKIKIESNNEFILEYFLKPLTRGEYVFGNINLYVNGPLRFVKRRFTFFQEEVVKVYPSYQQMRRFQLLAVSNRLQEAGVKRIRKLGHSLEFEQIKEYVRGDDYRTINWKATARRGDLMVNNFTDERSQQIFCLVNKSRMMKMPFDGMTLLDHAINAALVLLNVAMLKQDKAGLITFAQTIDTYIAADKKPGQLNSIMEALYQQQTRFLEPDLEQLFSTVRNRITQRSLLVLFTNYETMESLQRDLPFYKRLA